MNKCTQSEDNICMLDDQYPKCSGIGYDAEHCGDYYLYSGENPPLTEPLKGEILTAHRINCGKVSRCSICGHPLPNVKGCFACVNCGNQIGVCG